MPAAAQQDRTWTGQQSDNWQHGANWANGLPPADHDRPYIDSGNYLLRPRISGVMGPFYNKMFIGNGNDAELVVSAGSNFIAVLTYVGYQNDSFAEVVVSDPGTRFHQGELYVGYGGTGLIRVGNGGFLDTDHATLGYYDDPDVDNYGRVEVTGDGSRWRINRLFAGNTSNSEIRVEQGGRLETVREASIADNWPIESYVTIVDSGSVWDSEATIELARDARLSMARIQIVRDALVKARDGVFFGEGEGILVIRGQDQLRGTLETDRIWTTTSDWAVEREVRFDNGRLRLTDDAPELFENFTHHDVDARVLVEDGGVTIDTQSYYVRPVAPMEGVGSDSGALRKFGSGVLRLDQTNTFAGGVELVEGELHAYGDSNLGSGNGTIWFRGGTFRNLGSFSTARPIDVFVGGGTVHTDGHHLRHTGALTGNYPLTVTGGGRMTIDGETEFYDRFEVEGGAHLVFNAPAQDSAGEGVQASDGRLSGNGHPTGPVEIGPSAVLAPGDGVGTLTTDSLTIDPEAVLAFELEARDTDEGGNNDHLVVEGDLILDGQLDVVDAGDFDGRGDYLLISYSGDLTDNGLTVGNMPEGVEHPERWSIDTSTPGEVRLLRQSQLDVISASNSLGTVAVGESVTRGVTLANAAGETSFEVQDILTQNLPPSLSLTGGTCQPLPQTLQPGEWCEIEFTYAPQAPGELNAIAGVESNAPFVDAPIIGFFANAVAPTISVAPSSLDFGEVEAGAVGSASVTVENTADETVLEITGLPLAGEHADDFAVGGNCAGASLAGGESCQLDIDFVPAGHGNREAELIIESNAFNGPAQVDLAGFGRAAELTVDPAPVGFGDVRVGETSPPVAVTVSNTGNSELDVSDDGIVGDDHQDFDIVSDECLGQSVAPGASCIVELTFSPSVTGMRTSTLGFESNGPSSPTLIDIGGNGVQSAIELEPQAIDFGPVRTDADGAIEIATISNSGTADLNIAALEFIGDDHADFSLAANGCGQPVAPGDQCPLEIRFSPGDIGTRQAALQIQSDAPSSPASLALEGLGVEPELRLSPEALDFGDVRVGQASEPIAVVIGNGGSADLNLGVISISGEAADDYSLVDNACVDVVLAPEGECSLEVAVSPSQTGPRPAELLVPSDDPAGPHSVTLAANGTEPELTVSPESVDFGDARVGEEAEPLDVVVTNTGSADLNLAATAFSGEAADDYSLIENDCQESTLAPDENCIMSVTIAPSQTGPRPAALDLLSDAPESPHAVTLSATGVESELVLDAETLDFGEVRTDETSDPVTLQVSNTGSADLHIESLDVTGNHADDFAVDNETCTGTAVAPDSECVVNLALAPAEPGEISASLELASDAPESPHTVSLEAVGVAPEVAIEPGAVDFGEILVDEQTDPAEVMVSNAGTAALHVESAFVEGEHADDFNLIFEDCSDSPIEPDSSCALSVALTPSAPGKRSATLVLDSDALSSPHQVDLSGSGLEPELALEPARADFGEQPMHETSEPVLVELSNAGDGELQIDSLEGLQPPFEHDSEAGSCGEPPFALAPSAQCRMAFTFTPGDSVLYEHGVELVGNAPSSPDSIELEGRGIELALSLSQASARFTIEQFGQAEERTVTVTNVGGGAVTLSELDAPASPFSLGAGGCTATPLVLDEGEVCELSLRFEPGERGLFEDELVIESDATHGPLTVSLRGFTAIPVPAVNPAVLALLSLLVLVLGLRVRRAAVFLAGRD